MVLHGSLENRVVLCSSNIIPFYNYLSPNSGDWSISNYLKPPSISTTTKLPIFPDSESVFDFRKVFGGLFGTWADILLEKTIFCEIYLPLKMHPIREIRGHLG